MAVSTSVASHWSDPSLLAALQACVRSPIRTDLLGSSITTFAIGGPVEALVSVVSNEELAAIRGTVAQSGLPVRIVGNGSNVLVSDAGLAGVTVKLGGDLRSVAAVEDGFFDVGAAASLMSLARKVSQDGYSGLEFAAGIPATIGGALFMNAGAHGSEIGERVVFIDGVFPDGSTHRFAGSDLPWCYRSSGLPPDFFVTSARLKLVAGDRSEISARLAHNLEERRRRQPLSLPSAGSVFKNPRPDLSAGAALERAGLKGVRLGGAMVSELHANWIVNPSKEASASDVRQLIELCQQRVRDQHGIELHPEVRVW